MAKGERGRPAHEPTDAIRKKVLLLARESMLDQARIAKVLDIGETTLKKYYAEELAQGAAQVEADIGASLYKLGIQLLHPATLIFLGKCRLGMRETDHAITQGNTTIVLQSGNKPARLITEKADEAESA